MLVKWSLMKSLTRPGWKRGSTKRVRENIKLI